MSVQIWSTSSEKRGDILVLLDQDIHQLKVTGSPLTFGRKFKQVLEALDQGKHPREAGANSVQSLELSKIAKAEIAPGNAFITLHGEGGAPQLSYVPVENNADQIFQAILERSGQTFEPKQEEIGVGEALMPPGIVGVIGGVLWAALYNAATRIAEGEEMEGKGRRRGLQNLLIGVADTLGPNGTIAVGVILLLLVLFWAGRRIVKRPVRTVWLPSQA